jgi:hypothetical protein
MEILEEKRKEFNTEMRNEVKKVFSSYVNSDDGKNLYIRNSRTVWKNGRSFEGNPKNGEITVNEYGRLDNLRFRTILSAGKWLVEAAVVRNCQNKTFASRNIRKTIAWALWKIRSCVRPK